MALTPLKKRMIIIMKIGIVCEGGAMRGVYTTGVLQSFLDANFMADLLVGVSAGASNGISYVSRQSGRLLRTNVDYIGDKRYLSFSSYLRTKSVFGWDFIFGEIPEKLDPFDYDSFRANPCDFLAGATNIETGRCHFFGKDDIAEKLMVLRASCSMPFFAPIIEFQGMHLLDGGVSDPIPVDRAMQEGCDKVVVILTRERGFKKKRESFGPLLHTAYRKYPKLIQAMDTRHLAYNHALARVQRLEQEGRAIVVAPENPLPIGRFAQDRDNMMFAYNLGLTDGGQALQKL